MAQSKAARRRARRRQGGGFTPYARMRPMSDWVVGSIAVLSTGLQVGGPTTPTSIPTWNPAGAAATYTLASGTPLGFMAISIAAGVTSSIPGVGRLRVEEVKGVISLNTSSAAGYWAVAVGMFVTEFTVGTGAWDFYDPITPTDAARDDWFFLESWNFQMGPAATNASIGHADLPVNMKTPITLGGGQGLLVVISAISTPGALTVDANPCFRTRIGQVA